MILKEYSSTCRINAAGRVRGLSSVEVTQNSRLQAMILVPISLQIAYSSIPW